MRKKIIFMITGIMVSMVLHGCVAESTITYQDTEMTVSEAEERIADQLEVENPDLDLEISITEESDE